MIVLISCVSQKQQLEKGQKVAAKELYTSPLFKKSWAYANKLNPDTIYILSAKYGLLKPETQVTTYNETLNDKKAAERRDWSEKVLKALKAEGVDLKKEKFIILAGKSYYQYLLGEDKIEKYELPMEGLGIGKRLHYLNERI